MRNAVKKVVSGFLGVIASLALLFILQSAPVLADDGVTELVVKVNDKAITGDAITQVTPLKEYEFGVFKTEDLVNPLPVEEIAIIDEQGNPAKSNITKDDSDSSLHLNPAKEDAGKTLSITFTTKTDLKSVTVHIKVNQIVEKITLNKTTYTMNIKDKLKLNATVSPLDAVNKELVWKTSAAKVATVSRGVVSAKGPGTCTITASLKDGSMKVSCKVSVRKPALNSSRKVIAKSKSFTLKVLYLKGKVTWETSNSKVATVKNGVVTAKKSGTVTITAVSGTYKLTCKVKVTDPSIVNSSGEGVEGINVTNGFKRILKVKGGSGKVTWESSNKEIATVKDGIVKGEKKGSCYVYAKVDGKTLKCKVTVKSNVFETTPIKNGRYMRKGKVSLSNASFYYSGGQLIYKCYAVNSTTYKKVERYNNISISIYVGNKLVAKQSYKNIQLNLKKYKAKALTFTFSSKNVKSIVDLRTSKITVSYSYDYQYSN